MMRTTIPTLQIGWYLFYQGSIVQITALDPSAGILTVEDHLTHNAITLNQIDLFTGTDSDHLLVAPTLADLQYELARHQPLALAVLDDMGLPETFLSKAAFMIEIVDRIDARVEEAISRAVRTGQRLTRTTALKQVIQMPDIPVGLTTYYKYRELYQQYSGSRAQIAASLRRSTFNQVRMTPAQLHFIDTLIREEYLRPQPVRKRQLYRLAASILARTNGYWADPQRCAETIPDSLIADLLNPSIPLAAIQTNPDYQSLLTPIRLPSERWFYNYLAHFEHQPDAETIMVARYGQAAWDRQHTVFDTFVATAAAPLQLVFADHWQLDVISLDEAGNCIRLWLTLLIDAYSRCVLGMALLPEQPCIESIQQALLHAIWPKQSHRAWGLTDEWACYGIPLQLSLDNAWAHHSYSLEDLTRSLSLNGQYQAMTLVFRPPYRGRYGAIIERLFGNFSDQVKQFLPGAIQAGGQGTYQNALKSACLRYDDLNRFLHELILHYQHTPHQGLGGMTPHSKWLEGLQMGLPLVPRRTPAIERLFWRMDPRPRTLTSKGISAFGLHYSSLALGGAARIDTRGQRVRYTIRYNPTDISCLALFQDGHWLGDVYANQLRLPDGSTQSLSLAERDIARELACQTNHPVRDWLQFTRFWQQLGKTRQAERHQTSLATPDFDQTAALLRDSDTYEAHYTDLVRRFTQS